MSLQRFARKLAFWFVLPAFLCMLVVHVIPIFWGGYLSFLDLDIYTVTRWSKAPFVGFRNFLTVFSPRTDTGVKYLRSIGNVIYYGLVTIPAGYFVGLGVAILLNRRFWGRSLVRGLVLLPYIPPDSVVYNVWRLIFQARIGLVNKYLFRSGGIKEPAIWLVGDRAI
ncbi:MAG: sugar ABC transporter permease, partial [Atribacterota bacterium]|nr:sugar ABC transporter permease [Atribacterota bacterium]